MHEGLHRLSRRVQGADLGADVALHARDRELETVEPGELLAIRDTGAYGFAMASTYNMRPRPAEVMIEDGRVRLIRRRETFEDLIATEV
jgi:diaminopimelate decarboxylase